MQILAYFASLNLCGSLNFSSFVWTFLTCHYISLLTGACSKLAIETLEKGVKYIQAIKTPELHQWRPSGTFIVNVEQISHFFIVFQLLTLNK